MYKKAWCTRKVLVFLSLLLFYRTHCRRQSSLFELSANDKKTRKPMKWTRHCFVLFCSVFLGLASSCCLHWATLREHWWEYYRRDRSSDLFNKLALNASVLFIGHSLKTLPFKTSFYFCTMGGIDGDRVIYSSIIIYIISILTYFFVSLQENISILKLQIRQPVIMQSLPLRCQEINRHVA